MTSFAPAVAAPEWTLADFDFELPPELIAQQPAPQRAGSRLLDGRGAQAQDLRFSDFPSLLQPGDLLVFNDTQVIKARLYGHKPSGGRLELLVERVLDAARGEVAAGSAAGGGVATGEARSTFFFGGAWRGGGCGRNFAARSGPRRVFGRRCRRGADKK